MTSDVHKMCIGKQREIPARSVLFILITHSVDNEITPSITPVVS